MSRSAHPKLRGYPLPEKVERRLREDHGKTKKKRRSFRGHIPDERFELTGFQHDNWLLFARESAAPARWVELKLARRGASDMKSNFWLAWSPTERRFAMNSEFKMLACREAELLDALHDYLTDF